MKRANDSQSDESKKARNGAVEELTFEDELMMMAEEVLDGEEPGIELTD